MHVEGFSVSSVAMEQSPSEALVASSPPKKKRGRPKKADKLLLQQSDASAATPKGRQNKRKKGLSKSVPAASGRKKRKQQMSPSLTEISDSDVEEDVATPALEKEESTGSDANVGQQVHGVVDGMFDAGYLVTVRVGDTETVFRGVVFGPGLSLPLNAENDVAPKLKKMTHDDETRDVHVIAPSSRTILSEPGSAEAHVTSTASTAGAMHAPANSASLQASSSVLAPSEVHRAATIPGSSMGMSPSTHPQPQPQPALAQGGGPAGYTPMASYRSPMFVQSPLPNASGAGFYYVRNPNGNPGPAFFGVPPNGAFPGSYAFPYPPRAEYHAAPAPAPATAASISPSPNMQRQGTLPPRS
ncbi:hypothetical protein L7F22_060282 [Adiantum nelumboides]|nr:hypothetical protein [Adiantum nelumboides]